MQGYEDPDPAKRDQYDRWEKCAKQHQNAKSADCGVGPKSVKSLGVDEFEQSCAGSGPRYSRFVVCYLAQHRQELLSEFKKIAELESAAA